MFSLVVTTIVSLPQKFIHTLLPVSPPTTIP